MRPNRFSLTSLIALTFAVCAAGSGRLVLAQGKGQSSCPTDPAASRPARTPPPAPPGGSIFGTPPPRPRAGDRPILGPTPLPPISILPPPWSVSRAPEPPAPDPEPWRVPILEGPIIEPSKPPAPAAASLPEQRPSTGYRVIDGVFIHCASLLETRRQTTLTPFNAVGNSVSVTRFTGATPLGYYSNSIFIHGSTSLSRQAEVRLYEGWKSFLRALGPDLLASPVLHHARFMVTTKSGRDEFVTIFEAEGAKFGATVIQLNAPAASCPDGGCTMADVFEDVIDLWLKPVAGGGRVYMIGDDLELLDAARLAERFGCEVVRRPGRMQKLINNVERRLSQLQNRRLGSMSTTYVNGLPRDEAEAVRAGYQRNQVGELQDAAAKMDELARKFMRWPKHTAPPPPDLRELLLKDDSDVVFIVAHSDVERIYINGEAVSVEDIKKYPDRFGQSTRPRVAILLSCYAGDFNLRKGWFFRRDVESLAEVLIGKGYFDKVVAPKGEITLSEAVSILKDYFGGMSLQEIAPRLYPQLIQVAEAVVRRRTGARPEGR
jgi:hypothetical protein